MTIESTLERIAAALEAMSRSSVGLTAAPAASKAPDAAAPALTEPVKRGPGRPPKTEAPAAPPPETEDSFLDDASPTELTLDEVRKALVGYQQRASSAEKARAILKTAGGVDTLKALKPEKYRAVYDAANAA